MQVQFMKELSDHVAVVWRIEDASKRYAAQWSVKSGGWTIRSMHGNRLVAPGGKLGRQIIAAIEDHKGNA